MIYFLTGVNTRLIKLEEISKDFDVIKNYDAGIQGEYEKFLEDIGNVSIFDSSSELVILKRSEKLKKFKDLLAILRNYKDSKGIVIDYYCEFKNKNIYLNEFKNMNCKIINIENDDKLIEDYIINELKIKKIEAQKIISIIGKNYYHVKNEIFKYKSIFGDKFDFNKFMEILLENVDIKISNYLEKIYDKTLDFNKIQGQYYILLLYSIYKDFEIFHKLASLNLSKDYEEFKKNFSKYENIFSLNYYVVYLKNKNLKYSKEKCMKVLKKCIEMEANIKQAKIDEKTALWYIIKEIQT